VVALSIATAERHTLTRYALIPWTRLPLVAIGFIAAFWGGFYQPSVGGRDFDILLGSLVLGNGVTLGVVPARGDRLAATTAFFGLPLACFIGQFDNPCSRCVTWIGSQYTRQQYPAQRLLD
jgi:hypothetical protein